MTLEIIATVFVPIILSKLFYLMKNIHREFLGGNGNFLPLIDALDGCHKESVNTKVLQLFVNLLTGDPSYINLKHTLQEKFLLIRVYLGFFTQSKSDGTHSHVPNPCVPPIDRICDFVQCSDETETNPHNLCNRLHINTTFCFSHVKSKFQKSNDIHSHTFNKKKFCIFSIFLHINTFTPSLASTRQYFMLDIYVSTGWNKTTR